MNTSVVCISWNTVIHPLKSSVSKLWHGDIFPGLSFGLDISLAPEIFNTCNVWHNPCVKDSAISSDSRVLLMSNWVMFLPRDKVWNISFVHIVVLSVMVFMLCNTKLDKFGRTSESFSPLKKHVGERYWHWTCLMLLPCPSLQTCVLVKRCLGMVASVLEWSRCRDIQTYGHTGGVHAAPSDHHI